MSLWEREEGKEGERERGGGKESFEDYHYKMNQMCEMVSRHTQMSHWQGDRDIKGNMHGMHGEREKTSFRRSNNSHNLHKYFTSIDYIIIIGGDWWLVYTVQVDDNDDDECVCRMCVCVCKRLRVSMVVPGRSTIALAFAFGVPYHNK